MMLSKVAQVFQSRNLVQPSIGAMLEKSRNKKTLTLTAFAKFITIGSTVDK